MLLVVSIISALTIYTGTDRPKDPGIPGVTLPSRAPESAPDKIGCQFMEERGCVVNSEDFIYPSSIEKGVVMWHDVD